MQQRSSRSESHIHHESVKKKQPGKPKLNTSTRKPYEPGPVDSPTVARPASSQYFDDFMCAENLDEVSEDGNNRPPAFDDYRPPTPKKTSFTTFTPKSTSTPPSPILTTNNIKQQQSELLTTNQQPPPLQQRQSEKLIDRNTPVSPPDNINSSSNKFNDDNNRNNLYDDHTDHDFKKDTSEFTLSEDKEDDEDVFEHDHSKFYNTIVERGNADTEGISGVSRSSQQREEEIDEQIVQEEEETENLQPQQKYDNVLLDKNSKKNTDLELEGDQPAKSVKIPKLEFSFTQHVEPSNTQYNYQVSEHTITDSVDETSYTASKHSDLDSVRERQYDVNDQTSKVETDENRVNDCHTDDSEHDQQEDTRKEEVENEDDFGNDIEHFSLSEGESDDEEKSKSPVSDPVTTEAPPVITTTTSTATTLFKNPFENGAFKNTFDNRSSRPTKTLTKKIVPEKKPSPKRTRNVSKKIVKRSSPSPIRLGVTLPTRQRSPDPASKRSEPSKEKKNKERPSIAEKSKKDKQRLERDISQIDRAIRSEKRATLNETAKSGVIVKVQYVEIPKPVVEPVRSISPKRIPKTPTIPVRAAVEQKSYSAIHQQRQEIIRSKTPPKAHQLISSDMAPITQHVERREEIEEDNFYAESVPSSRSSSRSSSRKSELTQDIYLEQMGEEANPTISAFEQEANEQPPTSTEETYFKEEEEVVVEPVKEPVKRTRPKTANVKKSEGTTSTSIAKKAKQTPSTKTKSTASGTLKRPASASRAERSRINSSSDWGNNTTVRSSTPTPKTTKQKIREQPKVEINENTPIWKRLYYQGNEYKQRMEAWANEEREKKEKEEFKQLQKAPTISDNSKKILEDRSAVPSREPVWNRLSTPVIEGNVQEPSEVLVQRKSIENNKRRREKELESYEKDKLKECTFVPQIAERSLEIAYQKIQRGERDASIHDNLFKAAKEKNQYRKEILEEARKAKEELETSNSSRVFVSKKHETEFLRRMVNSNKDKEIKLRSIQDQLLQEANITFQPSICRPPSSMSIDVSNIGSDIFERSKEHLERKKQLEEQYDQYIRKQQTSVFTNKKSEQVMKEMRKKRLHSLYCLLVLDDEFRDGMIHVCNLKRYGHQLPLPKDKSLFGVVKKLIRIMDEREDEDLVLSFPQFEQFLYNSNLDVEDISQQIRVLQNEIQFDLVQEQHSKELHFKPQINLYSKELDRMRNTRKRMNISTGSTNNNDSLASRFEELLAFKEDRDEKIKYAKEVKIQQELEQCTFEPELIAQRSKKMKEIPPRPTWNYRSSLLDSHGVEQNTTK